MGSGLFWVPDLEDGNGITRFICGKTMKRRKVCRPEPGSSQLPFLIQLFQVIHEVFEFDGQVCVFNNALFSCSDLFCAAKIARSCGPDGNKEKYLQVCLNIRSRKIGMEMIKVLAV